MGQTKIRKTNKKPTRKSLVKALDTIVSLIVRARDKQCVNCGTRFNLTCGHLFSRTNYSTRWDLTNCNCQCRGCNLKHDHNPYPYQEWWKEQYGEQYYHLLYQTWSRSEKYHWTDGDLRELLDDLTNYYTRSTESERFQNFVSPVQLRITTRLQHTV